MPIPPDCERVPIAGVVGDSSGAGREMMLIPPDCERVPGSGITAGVTDAGGETMSILPDPTHIPGTGVAAGAPGPDREMVLISSGCERVKKGSVARVDRRLRRYYLIVRLLPNVFALACLSLSSI